MPNVSEKTRLKISLAFKIIASIGLAAQIIIISIEFFKYSVNKEVEFVMPKKLYIPDLTLCMKIWDSIPLRNPMKFWQALNYTVPETDVLLAQVIRKGSKYCGVTKKVNQCNGSMIVSKWVISDNICYTLTYNFSHGNGMRRETLSNTNLLTDNLKNTFYTIVLSSILKNMTSFTPVIHDPKTSPVNSYDVSEFHKREKIGHSMVHSGYHIAFRSYTINLLPSPYTTNCKYYRTSQLECKEECSLNHYIENSEEFPEDVFFSNTTTFADRTFDTGLVYSRKRIKSCFASKACHKKDCKLKYSVSSVKGVNSGDAIGAVVISLVSPLDPYIEVDTKPSFPMFEYILYIASCLGIWFGISFLSLNPFPVNEMNKETQKIKVLPTEYNKCVEEIRTTKRQNAILFMKINVIEKTIDDLFSLI